MTEKYQSILIKLVHLICFILFVTLVVVNQRTTGYSHLLLQLLGLAGLLVQLWLYNRKFR